MSIKTRRTVPPLQRIKNKKIRWRGDKCPKGITQDSAKKTINTIIANHFCRKKMKILTILLVIVILGFDFATPKRKSYDISYFYTFIKS